MSLSASEIKGQANGMRRKQPDPNTKIGRFYAALLTGQWISKRDHYDTDSCSENSSGVYENLRNRYELELEFKRTGFGPTSKVLVRCLGYWTGADFTTVSDVEEALEFIDGPSEH